MSKISSSKLADISKAANDVILLLDDRHPDYGNHNGSNSERMVKLWDYLNDKAAPPSVVKSMADDLINCRDVFSLMNAEIDRLQNQVAELKLQIEEASAPPVPALKTIELPEFRIFCNSNKSHRKAIYAITNAIRAAGYEVQS